MRTKEAPLATVATAGHVTTLPAPSVPALDALTKITVGGSVSRTTTFGAVAGPRFCVVIV